MYVQVTGTQSTYGIGITFDGTHYIYTGNGSFAVATSLTVGTTYICTFYGTSGNPWGSNYPSWTFSALSYNEIPLNIAYLKYFITSSYSDSIIGIFGINTSSLLNGQVIRFKDGGNYASTESVRLVLNHNTPYINFNTNGFSTTYIYLQNFGFVAI